MKELFGVWCEVSGGVTGHRSAWLKAHGRVRMFETLEAAQAVAAELNNKIASNPKRKAEFRYSAREYRDSN